jgi:UDP-2,4-diacetamido-2,4,6-trideoxy-beta-L-altropyranose hydrolase
MNVVFRVDSSAIIGSGHVMRCLVLARELKSRGANVHFICRDHRGNIISLIEKAFFRITILESAEDIIIENERVYSEWLGVDQEFDALQTLAAIGEDNVDCLIVDHYSLDFSWESILRERVSSIFVIDDLANRRHDCDVLLDSNYTGSASERYAELVSSECITLFGPEYAIMSDRYRVHTKIPRIRDGSIKNILVYFGGSDQNNLTGRCLEALDTPELSGIAIDVVRGTTNPHAEYLHSFTANRENIRLHENLPDLSVLINRADLGIGAAGVTTWERMCLGLPSIVVTIAENQEPAATALADDVYISYLGKHSEVTVGHIRTAVTEKLLDKGEVISQAAKSRALVDGNGVLRVAEFICSTNLENVILEQKLAVNDDETNNMSCSTEPESPGLIELGQFNAPCNDYINREICFKVSEISLGYVRFTSQDNTIHLDYKFHALASSRGWEDILFERALKALVEGGGKVNSTGVRTSQTHSLNKYLFSSFGRSNKESVSALKIAILSHPSSWINSHIAKLVRCWVDGGNKVLWVHDAEDLIPGDFCFYLGCEQIVGKDSLCQFTHNLVVHESDLPHGRGWSPLTWQVLEGKISIPIVLFEATDSVDAGKVYLKDTMTLSGTELVEDLRNIQGSTTVSLCMKFVDEYKVLVPLAYDQSGEATFYPRRSPIDSQTDITQTIESVFPLLQVSDYEKYPVFFEMNGRKFKLKIEEL